MGRGSLDRVQRNQGSWPTNTSLVLGRMVGKAIFRFFLYFEIVNLDFYALIANNYPEFYSIADYLSGVNVWIVSLKLN